MLLINEEMMLSLVDVTKRAGEAAMKFYNAPESTIKDDGSPLTAADMASQHVIEDALSILYPDVTRISEEKPDGEASTLQESDFFLIDPLDGTKEFIKRNGEFTINIALIRNRRALLGIVHAPATGEFWYGVLGLGAWKKTDTSVTKITACSPCDPDGLVVACSRSHASSDEVIKYLQGDTIARLVPLGSSLKLCKIAEGVVDVYPRLGTTMEWDIAAGHAVLASAGGVLTELSGNEFLYAKPAFRNNHFVARGNGLK